MSKEPNAPATTIDVSGLLAKLQELCGPPPVLSTESLEAYNQILAEFSKCIRPQDFVEQILAKDAADGTFEAARYQRHKTLLIERRFRDSLAVQAQRKKASAQKKEKAANDVAAGSDGRPTEPDEVLEGLVEEVDAILQQNATELDHARALEVGIVYLERLDRLRMAALARRNHALQQLERYRDGLGYRLRSISDHIINGVAVSAAQLAAPSVSPEEQP